MGSPYQFTFTFLPLHSFDNALVFTEHDQRTIVYGINLSTYHPDDAVLRGSIRRYGESA
jgi:hypothetical protein